MRKPAADTGCDTARSEPAVPDQATKTNRGKEENGRGMRTMDALSTGWGASTDGDRTWCAVTTDSSTPVLADVSS